jgi:hypothetical protein
MKKITFLVFSFVMAFVFTTSALGGTTADAAVKKQYLDISENVFYYGQVKNGKPNGKGTMTWYPTKSYSGDWVDGKRTGSGKYVHRYKSDNKDFVITYEGQWKKDLKIGNGSYSTKVTDHNGKVESHKIQFGTFANDRFAAGFSVAHTLADQPYSFNYKDAKTNIQLSGSNVNMRKVWKEGKFDSIQYSKEGVIREYSVASSKSSDETIVKENKAHLKYLQSLQSEMNLYLDKWERLSRRVPLA